MFGRSAVINLPSLLLLFGVVPFLALSALLLPSRAFIATISFLCLHSRAPHWKGFASLCCKIIAVPWKEVKVIGNGGTDNVQTVFVVTPSAWSPLLNSSSWQLIAWAIVRQHVTASLDRPLCVVTEMPAYCNAPVLRLLFQLAGWHDFRTDSVKRLLDRGFSLLLFDQQLADLQLAKAAEPVQFVQYSLNF